MGIIFRKPGDRPCYEIRRGAKLEMKVEMNI